MTMLADGFEEALVGFGNQVNELVAIYDYWKCVDILMEKSDMERDEAVEYMEFNVLGAHVGTPMPIFLDREITMDDVKGWAEEESGDDLLADADALKSAGWGTDEDYGGTDERM